jgi:hypothetical protein
MTKGYKVNREARAARRSTRRTVQRHAALQCDGETMKATVTTERSDERAELAVVVSEMARAFKGAVDFYKAECGGGFSHEEALNGAAEMQEYRRNSINLVDEMPAEGVGWATLSAIAEVDMPRVVKVWSRVREAAADELESGRRSALIIGHAEPWEMAQFLAIRDAFMDEWQPRGGIEAAMIDMLAVAFSLQMYWATIAHVRATKEHDKQKKDVARFEVGGWKSPYQSEAEAVDQANRLADGYNRQFLRVLRQLRDLRRYAPPVIVNNGGQVNVAANGGQQVNVT